MDLSSLFREHIAKMTSTAAKTLSETGFDTLVLGAGSQMIYYADDMEPPFRSNPHFASFCPLKGPHHALVVKPGKKPRLIRWAPRDYWYERAPFAADFWTNDFEIDEAPTAEGVFKGLGSLGRAAFVGDDEAGAKAAGLSVNPEALVKRLDWDRAIKTAYEVECLLRATAASSKGHNAARDAFLAQKSELAIHHAYVEGASCTDDGLPYPTIVCLNEKAAILHYHAKRAEGSGKVLLLDAGASDHGYGCDITRTSVSPSCDPRFKALSDAVNRLQLELCAMVTPGGSYVDIHLTAHLKIARTLVENGVLKCTAEAAVEKRHTSAFFPHGVGHHLGIQVHDIGGHQKARDGGVLPPPEAHPYLRNTRVMETGHVFTIEPGIYFVPMLLEPLRTGPSSADFNWPLIDALSPCGGIRVEDNVVVTKDGHRNLTREFLPN